MEATGVYWQDYAYFLHSLKVTVSVVNPVQISLFARSLLTRAKTDKIDAMTIAKYGAVMRPKAWSPPEAAVETLKLLNHEREALVLHLTRERNRQHALAHRHESNAVIERLHTERVQQLQEQVRQLDEAIQSCFQSSSDLEQQYKLLVSVPGVGRVTAVTLLAETEGFRNVASSRQLVAYAGIAPAPNQSGLMTKKSCISKVGNVRLRRSLYLAAVPATRTKTSLGVFYRRLRQAGKPPKVALVALARKILCISFAVVRSKEPFDVNYGQPLA